MANLLILSLVFRPDNVSTAHLVADLAQDLQSHGHQVVVVTTTPHYNPDPSACAAQPLNPCWGGIVSTSSLGSVPVYHVWMPAKGRNKIYRAVTWMWFHLVSTGVALVVGRKPSVVLAPSPPLTIGLCAWLVATLRGARFIYNVQEIYPDVAVNLGIIRNKAVIGVMKWIEAFVYRRARFITVISRRMCDNLERKGVPDHKLRLVPNFVDIGDFTPGEKDNPFARQYDLQRSFVIGYAGNMGKPQHLELLIEAAQLLRERQGIKLLMMGNGSEYSRLEDMAKGLSNVRFIPQQPYTLMPLAYAAMDVCYVPQAPGTSADGIPSKVYRILSAARPVLAYTDDHSDVAALVREARAGVVVTESKASALAEAISSLADAGTQCAVMGKRGREFVQQRYERHVVSSAYNELVNQAAIIQPS